MNKNKLIPLNSRLSITADFFYRLYMAIEDNKSLVKDAKYCAKKMCGKAFWNELSIGERKQAGICISQLVRYKLLNFDDVKGKHEYPKHYQLK